MAESQSNGRASAVNLPLHDNLAPIVDELGDLLAEKRALEAREKALKAELIALGAGELLGSRWRARISSSIRTTLDPAKARELLGDLADSCLRFTPVEAVRVDAIGARP
jgi:hypothetical protein